MALRLGFLFVLVCSFACCYSAPKQVGSKVGSVVSSPNHKHEKTHGNSEKDKAHPESKPSNGFSPHTRRKETLLAKLHDEKERRKSNEDDMAVTRLSASGDDSDKGNGPEKLGEDSDYWGDMAGDDLNSSLDHDLDFSTNGDDTSGASSEGASGSARRPRTRDDGEKRRLRKKDFNNVVRDSKGAYTNRVKVGGIMKLGHVKSAGDGRSVKQTRRATSRKSSPRGTMKTQHGSNYKFFNAMDGISEDNKPVMPGEVLNTVSNHDTALDMEDFVRPYVGRFHDNAAGDVFNVQQNALETVSETSGNYFNGGEEGDEYVMTTSGMDEVIQADDDSKEGITTEVIAHLPENSGDNSGDSDHEAIKGRKIHLGHLHEKGKNNTSSYVPNVLNPVPFMDPHLKYVYYRILNAFEKGALCLDGSEPGYFFRKGFGDGEKKWIIYLQGGAWCDSEMDCYERSKTNLGSSKSWNHLLNAEGILSHDIKENKHYYNWNVVYVPYCDGSSFTGNRSEPVEVKDRTLHFGGKRILSGLMDDLRSVRDLGQASNVVFTGTSAGALAVMLNADYVKGRLPPSTHMVAMADSGIFVNEPNLKGFKAFPESMKRVYKLHNSSGSIYPKCAKKEEKDEKWRCLFPATFGEYIKTPLYLILPLYDSWQLANIIGVHCVYHPRTCSKENMKIIKKFRKKTLRALEPMLKNKNIAAFANNCIDHGQVIFSQKWANITVSNTAMQEAFYKWSENNIQSRQLVDSDRKLMDSDVGEKDIYPFNHSCWSHYEAH